MLFIGSNNAIMHSTFPNKDLAKWALTVLANTFGKIKENPNKFMLPIKTEASLTHVPSMFSVTVVFVVLIWKNKH